MPASYQTEPIVTSYNVMNNDSYASTETSKKDDF